MTIHTKARNAAVCIGRFQIFHNAHLALLRRSLEIEPGDIGTGADLASTQVQQLLTIGDDVPDIFVWIHSGSALIDMGQPHRFTQEQSALVRLLCPGQ